MLSPHAYNAKVGLCLVCPVTHHAKGYAFEVKLPDGLPVQGVVLADHLKSADFLDVARHPTITFKGTACHGVSAADFKGSGMLTIRGITRPIDLDMHYVGQWKTPYWTDAGDAGPITRIGFVGEARINRHDFQVSWNGPLEGDGVVVGDEVIIQLDVEALLEKELKKPLPKGGGA